MEIDYTATFGEKLYDWRMANNFSQTHVSKILNYTRETISGWEKGNILPNYEFHYSSNAYDEGKLGLAAWNKSG